MRDLRRIYGEKIVIPRALLGRNLNVGVIRGFAPLDLLADISRPDVFDQVNNPFGTQRNLDKPHAKKALEYALESLNVEVDYQVRAFTEIILNVRETQGIQIKSALSEGDYFEYSSRESHDKEGEIVSLEFPVSVLVEHATGQNIAISRIDGNHRLSAIDGSDEEDQIEYPLVPFAIFVDLTQNQERLLFRDINGKQKPMETAHLTSIEFDTLTSEHLYDQKKQALYIAGLLIEPDGAFYGKVFKGGSKVGVKAELGGIPPLRINALKTAIMQTLKHAGQLTANYLPFEFNVETNAPSHSSEEMQRGVETVHVLIDRYWQAVKDAYPTAWQDRKNYIILQSIGINAFSKLAADVIQHQVFVKRKVDLEDFKVVLRHIASKVPMDRASYPGIAGAGGAEVIYKKLALANSPDDIDNDLIQNLLVPNPETGFNQIN